MRRRTFVKASLGGLAGSAAALRAEQAAAPHMSLGLERISATPLKIAEVELLRSGEHFFVRTRTADGATGIAVANERVRYLYPILQQLVIPFFAGKDARDLEQLIDDVYVFRSNYKLGNLALWTCVSWVEFSILDLLGKIANKPAGELLGGVIRKQVPVYLSSLRRDTTPAQEVAWMSKRLQETGARAVKLKIGGRMSNNADASPGRTDRLIPLARKTFGDKVTIYVDANGSYDAAHAIEVGKMLEAHNVAFLEEPCPFDEYEETKRVADALKMAVAGGEQDTSVARFRWMIRERGVDIVQPDVSYNGGLIRTLRVARLAAAAKMPVTPHSPQLGPQPVYTLHLASCTANFGPFLEYNGAPHKKETWFTPGLEIANGTLAVPTGPGLGITIDPNLLKKSRPVSA